MQSAWLQLATFECHVSPGLVRIRELGTSLPRSPAASGWLAGCPACLIYQQNLPDGQSLSLCDLPARRVVPFECSSTGISFAVKDGENKSAADCLDCCGVVPAVLQPLTSLWSFSLLSRSAPLSRCRLSAARLSGGCSSAAESLSLVQIWSLTGLHSCVSR